MIALKKNILAPEPTKGLALRKETSGCAPATVAAKNGQPLDFEGERGAKIKRILVPTDFSASSNKAVAQAAELARRHEATLTVLHVIDINAPAAARHCGTAEALMNELRSTGITGLCQLTETLEQDRTKVRTRLIEGLPAEAIVESSSGFDLLVIGRRQRKAWNFFARHTVERVTNGAECPVVLVDDQTGLMERVTRKTVNVEN